MKITAAKWQGGQLILASTDPEAIRFCNGFEEGEYIIQKAKKKRSLDANGYAFALIGKLAAELRLSKTEVYRNAIRDIGGNYETVCIKQKGLEALKRIWEAKGLGWQVEEFPSKLPGCVNANLYYGSSAYDVHQMSVFIDHLVQDCKALGIETLPPEKLAGMMEEWRG